MEGVEGAVLVVFDEKGVYYARRELFPRGFVNESAIAPSVRQRRVVVMCTGSERKHDLMNPITVSKLIGEFQHSFLGASEEG